jgi:hypothetical protein
MSWSAEPRSPVGDISWYAGGGGTVECGPQRITYTGVSTIETGSSTGFVNPPPAQTGFAAATGGITRRGTYLVAMTYKTAEGETVMGPTTASRSEAAHQTLQYERRRRDQYPDRSEGHR